MVILLQREKINVIMLMIILKNKGKENFFVEWFYSMKNNLYKDD